MDLAIGDELTPGYNPKNLNSRSESKVLTKALGHKVVSSGLKGASLTIKNKTNVLHQLNQFSMPAYDRVFLFYGENDYLYSKANLIQIGNTLNQVIETIRKHSQWIKVYGILPLPMYDKKGYSMARHRGPGVYTLHDLINMLSVTYENNDANPLNWSLLSSPIVSKINYKKRLKNGRLPTKQTYQLMADRIGEFVKKCEN